MDNIKCWLFEREIIYEIWYLLYDRKIEEAISLINDSKVLIEFMKDKNEFDFKLLSERLIKEIDKFKNSINYKENILQDYDKLFLGPNEILAPLWESTYRTKDKLLFGKYELEVRKFYNNIGLDIEESIPADYLPLEFKFMSYLCSIYEDDNLGNEDSRYENISKILLVQKEFLKEHILSWIDLWEDKVNRNSKIKLWKCCSQLTTAWIKFDFAELEKVILGMSI